MRLGAVRRLQHSAASEVVVEEYYIYYRVEVIESHENMTLAIEQNAPALAVTPVAALVRVVRVRTALVAVLLRTLVRQLSHRAAETT